MTVEEFSDEFDTLLDSYNVQMPFGYNYDPPVFNEYEKSVYLTKAQEEYVVSYYSSDVGKESFETTEEVRRYLDLLVITCCPEISATPNTLSDSFKHTIFSLPSDTWFIVYEQATYGDGGTCNEGFAAEVVPTTHDSFYRTKNNPFRGPSRRRVLRLDSGLNTVELISKYSIGKYEIRYIKRPKPIILANLNDLTINGESNILTCELNTVLHRPILERAVLLALSSRAPKTKESEDKNNK